MLNSRPLFTLRRALTTLARAALPAALLGLASIAACSDSQMMAPAPPLPTIPCDSSAARSQLEAVDTKTVAIWIDPAKDANLKALTADMPKYLSALWEGVTPTVTEDAGAPSDAPLTLWLSTGDAAKEAAGSPMLEDGYAIRRFDSPGGLIVVVYAPDTRNLAHGAYALLEELGARFFHPMQDFVPHFPGAFLPGSLAIERSSPFRVRGVQLHLLHPIEYFASFQEPSDAHLEEAKRFIDWLVKTGQNHIQWWLLKSVDWAALKPHAKAILDYAHSRGLTAFAVAQLFEGSSLQNGVALVEDEAAWQTEIDAGMDRIFELPFDGLELGMGEFFAADPAKLIEWLNHATAHATSMNKKLTVINHVGNYPNLYVDYQGKTEYFYFLPQYADPALINTVHTVFFFDLYREGGMYGHENFHMHRDFLFQELPKRPMRYQPESAYWVTADIDVPAFLPEYIYSRWVDIHNLDADIRAKGLPPLDGHVLFSSGHEWGYWMTDYLTAKMLWEPEQDFDHFTSMITSVYGSCSTDIHKVFTDFIDIQTKYLFDKKLIPYISGEDVYDDLGVAIEKETHPPRVRFEAVLAMSDEERATFEADTLGGVSEAAAAIEPLEQTAAAACRGADPRLLPFCAELSDGIAIVRLRLLHSRALYDAVLDHARGGSSSEKYLADAAALTTQAAAVIARREPYYRFDLDRLVGSHESPTIYNFGYLRQAHTQCLWTRQEEQAAYVIATGAGPSPFGVRPCTD